MRSSIEDIGSDATDIVTHLLELYLTRSAAASGLTIAAWVKAAGQRPRLAAAVPRA